MNATREQEESRMLRQGRALFRKRLRQRSRLGAARFCVLSLLLLGAVAWLEPGYADTITGRFEPKEAAPRSAGAHDLVTGTDDPLQLARRRPRRRRTRNRPRRPPPTRTPKAS